MRTGLRMLLAGTAIWIAAASANAVTMDYLSTWLETTSYRIEPPRDCRRLVGLSYAAMGILSMAAVAA